MIHVTTFFDHIERDFWNLLCYYVQCHSNANRKLNVDQDQFALRNAFYHAQTFCSKSLVSPVGTTYINVLLR